MSAKLKVLGTLRNIGFKIYKPQDFYIYKKLYDGTCSIEGHPLLFIVAIVYTSP